MAGPHIPIPAESPAAPRTAQPCPFCAACPRAGDHADLQKTCSSISTTCTVKNVFLVLSWGKTPLVPLGGNPRRELPPGTLSKVRAKHDYSAQHTLTCSGRCWQLTGNQQPYLFLSSYFYIQCSRNCSLCKYVPEGRVRVFVLAQCTTNYSQDWPCTILKSSSNQVLPPSQNKEPAIQALSQHDAIWRP